MSSRLAACENCRKAKLACDHKRPTCSRCKNSVRAGICIYRTSPFRRKKITDSPSPAVYHSNTHDTPPLSVLSPRQNPYPNPGYLGSSSHATIFEHIPGSNTLDSGVQDPSDNSQPSASFTQMAGDDILLQGADTLQRILKEFPLSAMKDLVIFWVARGTNLALAEPFVEPCAESVPHLFSSLSHDEKWHLSCARHLLSNSKQPLKFSADMSFPSFHSQFLEGNFRWESLGIFFLAVSRATVDITFFPSLYMTRERRYTLRGLSTKLSDCALEISLSLDSLNDIQLVLQYENFIMHSFVDGDHSYHTWRRMGDVISSTFALGYHEDIDAKTDAPFYLRQLRKTAFARIYSADKNVSIFLGRPPRMTRRFCHFQIPSSVLDSQPNCERWNPEAKASYRAETRWSALCAALKEEILELSRDKKNEAYAEQISDIQARAEAQWQALPQHFQLQGNIVCYRQESPFERDFLISTRLNHLHVLFLLRLLLSNTLAEPDTSIMQIAEEMLSLVVEVIMIRDQIANSGTSLLWKVAHYGLPAAGMLALAILKQGNDPMPAGISRTKLLQDLSVFVAEIQRGMIVGREDPIYVLLSKATQTIQKLLDSFLSGTVDVALGAVLTDETQGDDWVAILGQDIWDFETGFWQNLADHPSMGTFAPYMTDLPP